MHSSSLPRKLCGSICNSFKCYHLPPILFSRYAYLLASKEARWEHPKKLQMLPFSTQTDFQICIPHCFRGSLVEAHKKLLLRPFRDLPKQMSYKKSNEEGYITCSHGICSACIMG